MIILKFEETAKSISRGAWQNMKAAYLTLPLPHEHAIEEHS